MLSRSEFDVMLALKKTPTASQRAIALRCGMSLGTVNAVVKSLGDRGLVEGGTLTAEGEDELSPYKVRNAVIMAAGLSSRMAPLSYECPKGVLKVRGEVLIERQIRQLKEAGIDDITVVVGFKKEEFFYLEDLFGVKIVVNTDYATRNNHATLFQVRDIIGNTYICSSDNYFASNPVLCRGLRGGRNRRVLPSDKGPRQAHHGCCRRRVALVGHHGARVLDA